ncbi:MAG: NifU family protein [Oculatellaceae cyanobacterium Prado106]|jgi:nitrite reductase/ring-hydroxylating ferredoxin subunit/Fe-S cluster biogenesis protein NfuA|nr:NifU family protein [Oculatellaceae cyanobacterium Prado106]
MVQTPVQPSTQINHQSIGQPTDQSAVTLEALVAEIERFEAIASQWDESQRATVMALKRSIEALHREALTRLIRSVKQDAVAALKRAAEDEVVYGVLRYHELVKAPLPPLERRIEMALAEVRPGLKGHQGDVELVRIQLPDRVEVRLIGACSSCPASSLTLSEGVEQAIKRYCPEITQVVAVSSSAASTGTSTGTSTGISTGTSTGISTPTSPFENGWREVTSLAEVPTASVLAMKVEGKSIILHRQGNQVTCFHNACSHLGVPIDSGEQHQNLLTCPYHGFQYRLDTGDCLTSPEIPLQRYPVEVRDGQVFVQLWG